MKKFRYSILFAAAAVIGLLPMVAPAAIYAQTGCFTTPYGFYNEQGQPCSPNQPPPPPPLVSTPVVVGSYTAPLPQGGNYTIQAGDTLGSISRNYNVSLGALLQANPQIANPNVISVGQMITIPSGNGGVIIQSAGAYATATPIWVQPPINAGTYAFGWGQVTLYEGISPAQGLILAPAALAEPTPVGEAIIIAGGIAYFYNVWVASDAPAQLTAAVSATWNDLAWVGSQIVQARTAVQPLPTVSVSVPPPPGGGDQCLWDFVFLAIGLNGTSSGVTSYTLSKAQQGLQVWNHPLRGNAWDVIEDLMWDCQDKIGHEWLPDDSIRFWLK